MSKAPTKVTIRDVAGLAGVSAMTVTRVMRNESQISDATREAVQKAIKALNYEPLQSARNLSSTFAKVIGLVVPHMFDEVQNKAGYEYLAALHLGALQVCNQHDYALMLLQVNDADSVQRLVRRANARNVGGYVVAAPATEIPGLISTLKEFAIKHAALSPFDADASELTVLADEREAVKLLVLHMGSMGHRDVAFVGGGANIRAANERLTGYKDALKRLKIKTRKELVIPTGLGFDEGLEAGRTLLRLDEPPTAIQCMTDDLAAGVIAAAHELGLRLPVDLSVTGFDDFGMARKMWPTLTTAHLPVEEMSAHATAQVIAALEGRHTANQLFPCEVKLRHSVADISSRP